MPSDLIEERDQIVSRHRYASVLDLMGNFKKHSATWVYVDKGY